MSRPFRPCTVPGCARTLHSATFCMTHYTRHKNGLDVFAPVSPRGFENKGLSCSVQSCTSEAHSKGLCHAHRRRVKNGKDLGSPVVRRDLCSTPGCAGAVSKKGLCKGCFAPERLRKQKAHIKAWQQARKNELRERTNAWRRNNPVAAKAQHHIRRARKTAAGGRYTQQEWHALLEAYGHRCLHCAKHASEVKLTVDHIVPVSKGGTSNIDNIRPLCGSCNSKKGNKCL